MSTEGWPSKTKLTTVVRELDEEKMGGNQCQRQKNAFTPQKLARNESEYYNHLIAGLTGDRNIESTGCGMRSSTLHEEDNFA